MSYRRFYVGHQHIILVLDRLEDGSYELVDCVVVR